MKIKLTIIVLVAVILVGALLTVYVIYGGTKEAPKHGFVIVATADGYNDSVSHQGSPTNPWPVITVRQGTVINITVYNNDTVAHGFQIAHYYDGKIEAIAPGQRIIVSFIANETGEFRMYCSIFCPIHNFMQYGQLVVT